MNPFRIWNRESTLQGFFPLTRPDKEDLPHLETDAAVHAYPPWHTALFYFYGWLPEIACLALMSVVFGINLLFIASECLRLSKSRFDHGGLAAGFALVLVLSFSVCDFVFLNYSVLVLAAFLLMNRALERGYDIAAGLAWSVMMIKPQVGILFVWPLLWRRRYLAIATAVVVCLVETAWTSFVVHESVVDLILQIPQIGKPYGARSLARLAEPILGTNAMLILTPFFFLLTGAASWFLRRNQDFLVCCVPPALFSTVWTYSSSADHVILLTTFALLSGMATSGKGRLCLRAAWVLGHYCAIVLFMDVWCALCTLKLFGLTGRDLLPRIAARVACPLLLLFIPVLIRDEMLRRKANHV